MDVIKNFSIPKRYRDGPYSGLTEALGTLEVNSCIRMDKGAKHGAALKMVRQAQARKESPVLGTFRVLDIKGIVHVWRTA